MENLTLFGRFLVHLFGFYDELCDVDDRSYYQKRKTEKELKEKTGLSIRDLDNMTVKEVLNYKK